MTCAATADTPSTLIRRDGTKRIWRAGRICLEGQALESPAYGLGPSSLTGGCPKFAAIGTAAQPEERSFDRVDHAGLPPDLEADLRPRPQGLLALHGPQLRWS